MSDPDAPRERRLAVATRSGERIEIEIADTGPGMSADVLTRVFEPLYSTRAFGTGLGLPTVKQIVERHGGEVTIDSTLGKGTSVVLSLPVAAAKARSEAA